MSILFHAECIRPESYEDRGELTKGKIYAIIDKDSDGLLGFINDNGEHDYCYPYRFRRVNATNPKELYEGLLL